MGAGRLGGLRFVSTGIPTSSFFSGGFEQGLGGPMARSSWKICQNLGWEARRLDPAGTINTPHAAAAEIFIEFLHQNNQNSKLSMLVQKLNNCSYTVFAFINFILFSIYFGAKTQ